MVGGQGLTRGVVKNIVTDGKDSKLALRQGLRELFGSCYEARIPVTVSPLRTKSWTGPPRAGEDERKSHLCRP